ncbi:MAG: VOC family protein [Rhodospirillales bacterium]
MAEVRFHHISLTCRDPLAVERFYSTHFGFMRARVVDLGAGGQIVFLRNREMYLELFQATADAPVAPAEGDGYPWPSVRNISFMVDDVDRKLAEMGAGAVVAFGPLAFDAFIPGWKSAWLRDPDGRLVQITQGFCDDRCPPPPPASA